MDADRAKAPPVAAIQALAATSSRSQNAKIGLQRPSMFRA